MQLELLSLRGIFSLALLLLVIRYVNNNVVIPFRHSLKARRLGCGSAIYEPKRWPFGIDIVRKTLRADREQRTPDHIMERFSTMGRYTWGVSLLGSSNLITADPRNIQALLATQFDDFIMGAARRTNLKTALGRSIFAVDGSQWHNARNSMRPIFARENLSKLELLEEHFQTMVKHIEQQDNGIQIDQNGRGWTAPVSLAAILPCLTLDSAIELFLGHSSRSLDTLSSDKHEGPDFHHAFERMLAILGARMRLRNLYWLHGTKELQKCLETLHGFVDHAMDSADETREQVLSQAKYDLLDALRSSCVDRAEVREQVLGLLAAGRDTTASLMSWVFYCLVRHPQVFNKLRRIVLETFGSYSDSSPNHQDPAKRITFEKLKRCSYLQHVMNETLRLHSVVPFNSRCAAQDTTLPTGGGPDGTMPVFVPKGTDVNFSTHVLHRRKDLWGADADDFIPERWESKRPGLVWQFVAFNGGPRICIGQQFALTEAGFVLVRMLQRFDSLEGLDIDPTRDYHNFTIVCSPGSPVDKHQAVMCRMRISLE